DGIAIDPANPNRIAVGTAQWAGEMPQKIFLSNDKGSTWQEITGDLPGGLGTSDIAFSPDGQYLYITRYAGSVYKIKI
ncbi:MAG: PD40 domain-containing protein, partial [Thermodesulfovibrionia bacterium]|nr:PD40 domain-containing protein [Thermodesulfovibrionia bacterium]